jgi:hypothetical protein
MGDLEAAMNALDTYGLDIRKTFHEIYEANLPAKDAPRGVRFFRRVA